MPISFYANSNNPPSAARTFIQILSISSSSTDIRKNIYQMTQQYLALNICFDFAGTTFLLSAPITVEDLEEWLSKKTEYTKLTQANKGSKNVIFNNIRIIMEASGGTEEYARPPAFANLGLYIDLLLRPATKKRASYQDHWYTKAFIATLYSANGEHKNALACAQAYYAKPTNPQGEEKSIGAVNRKLMNKQTISHSAFCLGYSFLFKDGVYQTPVNPLVETYFKTCIDNADATDFTEAHSPARRACIYLLDILSKMVKSLKNDENVEVEAEKSKILAKYLPKLNNHPRALRVAAEMYYFGNKIDFNAAEAYFEQARRHLTKTSNKMASQYDNDGFAYLQEWILVNSYLSEMHIYGRLEQTDLNKVTEYYNEIKTLRKRIIEKQPDYCKGSFSPLSIYFSHIDVELGQLYYDQEQHKEAFEHSTWALQQIENLRDNKKYRFNNKDLIRLEHYSLHIKQCLGKMYLEGHGVAQDLAKAREYLQEPAEKGFTKALEYIATSYFKEEKYEEAGEFYARAIENTDSNDEAILGLAYCAMHLNEKELALRLFTSLAIAGNKTALTLLDLSTEVSATIEDLHQTLSSATSPMLNEQPLQEDIEELTQSANTQEIISPEKVDKTVPPTMLPASTTSWPTSKKKLAKKQAPQGKTISLEETLQNIRKQRQIELQNIQDKQTIQPSKSSEATIAKIFEKDEKLTRQNLITLFSDPFFAGRVSVSRATKKGFLVTCDGAVFNSAHRTHNKKGIDMDPQFLGDLGKMLTDTFFVQR